MKIVVDSERTKQVIIGVCRASLATGDLNVAKTAVVVAETIEIEKTKKEPKKK